MAIPDYESVMLPLLNYAADGKTHFFKDAVQEMAICFQVSEEELKKLLPSGKYPLFRSRVGWAKTYLTKAGLLELPQRGSLRITVQGLAALKQNAQRIDGNFLNQYPEFREFQSRSAANRKLKTMIPQVKSIEISSIPSISLNQGQETPDERLDLAFQDIYNGLAQDL